MEEKGVYLAIQTPRQVRKKPMYKNGMYRETDKMSDLICENYPMVLVMSKLVSFFSASSERRRFNLLYKSPY